MSGTVSEAVARPARGAIQGGVGYTVMELVEAFEIYDFTDRQWPITLIALTAVISFIQNQLEIRRGKGFFLRTIDPPEQAEVAGA